MKAQLAHIESTIFKRKVLEILDISTVPEEFREFETKLIERYDPFYLQCTVPSAEFKTIHFLESCGFNFVEYRMRCTKKLEDGISAHSLYPYELEEVGSTDDLKKIVRMAANQKLDDRFFSDPLLTPDLSIKRTREFIKRSYKNPDERLLMLVNRQTDELTGYRTFCLQQKNEVQLYLTGINRDAKEYNKYFEIINTLLLAYLKSKKINFAHAFISGKNFFELEFYLKKMEFTITGTSLLLRKIYPK